MSAAALNILFTLSALAGLAILVYGLSMKPEQARTAPEPDDLNTDIVLAFSDAEKKDELENIEADEKKPFEPEKYLPEKIEVQKKPRTEGE